MTIELLCIKSLNGGMQNTKKKKNLQADVVILNILCDQSDLPVTFLPKPILIAILASPRGIIRLQM